MFKRSDYPDGKENGNNKSDYPDGKNNNNRYLNCVFFKFPVNFISNVSAGLTNDRFTWIHCNSAVCTAIKGQRWNQTNHVLEMPSGISWEQAMYVK